MKSKRNLSNTFLIAILAAICLMSLGQAVNAQTPKTISGGVVNGKVLNWINPPYPPEAEANWVTGIVTVQVLIDEDGNIEKAMAISGPELLRSTCVQTTRQMKFAPTLLSGEKVKVSGVVVFNFGIGSELEIQTGHTQPIDNMWFTPNKKNLISTGSDRIILWDLNTRKPVKTISGESIVSVSNDGTRLLTTDDDTFSVWEISSGIRLMKSFSDECSFVPNSTRLGCRKEGILELIDTNTKKTELKVEIKEKDHLNFAFGIDGIIVTGGTTSDKENSLGTVRVWKNGKNDFTLENINHWEVSEKGKYLIYEDKKLHILDLTSNKNILEESEYTSYLITGNERFFVTANKGSAITVTDLSAGKITYKERIQSDVDYSGLSPNSKFLVFPQADDLEIINLEAGKQVAIIPKATLYSSEFANENRLIINSEGEARIVDLNSGEIIYKMPVEYGDNLALSQDNSKLFEVNRSKTEVSIKSINLSNKQITPVYAWKSKQLAEPLQAPSRVFTIRALDRGLTFRDTKNSGTLSKEISGNRLVVNGFDDQTIIFGTADGSINFFDLAAKKNTLTLKGNASAIDLDIKPNSTSLEINSDFYPAKYWDLKNGGFIKPAKVKSSGTAAIKNKVSFWDKYDTVLDESTGNITVKNSKTKATVLKKNNVFSYQVPEFGNYIALLKYEESPNEDFGTLELWNLLTKKLVFSVPNVSHSINYESGEEKGYQFLSDSQLLFLQKPTNEDEEKMNLEIRSVLGKRLFSSGERVLEYTFDDQGNVIFKDGKGLEWINLQTNLKENFDFEDDFEVEIEDTTPIVSPNKEIVVFKSPNHPNRVTVWNTKTGHIFWKTQHLDEVTSFSFSPDGKFLFSGANDGEIIVWSLENNDVLLTLIPLAEQDWVLFDPDGYFDFSNNAEKYLQGKFNDKFVLFNLFKEKRYKKGLWLSKLYPDQ